MTLQQVSELYQATEYEALDRGLAIDNSNKIKLYNLI